MVLVAVIRMNNNQVNSRVTTTIQIPQPTSLPLYLIEPAPYEHYHLGNNNPLLTVYTTTSFQSNRKSKHYKWWWLHLNNSQITILQHFQISHLWQFLLIVSDNQIHDAAMSKYFCRIVLLTYFSVGWGSELTTKMYVSLVS